MKSSSIVLAVAVVFIIGFVVAYALAMANGMI